jgi:hypothetical protein
MRSNRGGSAGGGRRISRLLSLLLAAPALSVIAASHPAAAAPEEIQVYEDDMDKPGQFGLDVHNNYVWGKPSPLQWTGEQQPDNTYRITPEFSYGLTQNVELGLYLPLATISNSQLHLDGVKFRVKYIAPKPAGRDWYWGANLEVGGVKPAYDVNPWNAELKGIVGWRHGPWDLAFNTNLDWVVSGPQAGSPSVQFATKASYKVIENLALGVESYNGVGTFDRFLSPAGQGHSTYLTADTSLGLWGLNVGIGHGYSGDPDQWLFKFIVSVPIDE